MVFHILKKGDLGRSPGPGALGRLPGLPVRALVHLGAPASGPVVPSAQPTPGALCCASRLVLAVTHGPDSCAGGGCWRLLLDGDRLRPSGFRGGTCASTSGGHGAGLRHCPAGGGRCRAWARAHAERPEMAPVGSVSTTLLGASAAGHVPSEPSLLETRWGLKQPRDLQRKRPRHTA